MEGEQKRAKTGTQRVGALPNSEITMCTYPKSFGELHFRVFVLAEELNSGSIAQGLLGRA